MYYAATNTYWVDPATGGLLYTTQNQKQYLQDSTGKHRLLLFDGDIVMTPQSLHVSVGLDSTGRNELFWFQDLGPMLAGVLGLVLLVAGIVLIWLKRRGQPEKSDAEEPEPALGPAL